MSVVPECIYVPTYMLDVCGYQNRVLDLLELKFQVFPPKASAEEFLSQTELQLQLVGCPWLKQGKVV